MATLMQSKINFKTRKMAKTNEELSSVLKKLFNGDFKCVHPTEFQNIYQKLTKIWRDFSKAKVEMDEPQV